VHSQHTGAQLPPGAPGQQWLVRCRDVAGRRRDIVVRLNEDRRIAVLVPTGEVAVLGLLEVGRLRGVLRQAVLTLDSLMSGAHSTEDGSAS
jgi:hypothetical protein